MSKSKLSTMTMPIKAMKYLYTDTKEGKIVCEIDIAALKKTNKAATIDAMVAEARIEYLTGKTKGFTDTKKLIKHLNS